MLSVIFECLEVYEEHITLIRTNGKENQAHYYYKCMTNATHNVAKDKLNRVFGYRTSLCKRGRVESKIWIVWIWTSKRTVKWRKIHYSSTNWRSKQKNIHYFYTKCNITFLLYFPSDTFSFFFFCLIGVYVN